MKLGLTGGIACGKSLALAIFAEAGAAVLETDRLAREVLETDPSVADAMRERWGGAVFDAERKPDRGAIAARVFSDEVELAFLESLLHPKVRETWTKRVAREPDRPWVVEIPLLFEKKLERYFDFTLCIAADHAIWRERLLKRGLSESDISNRIARQLPLVDKIDRADFVIHNNGSQDFLRRQVLALFSELTAAPDPAHGAFTTSTDSQTY